MVERRTTPCMSSGFLLYSRYSQSSPGTPASVEKAINLPEPPSFPELESHHLGKPKARAIHFIPVNNLLVVVYLEHGIMRVFINFSRVIRV